MNAFYILLVAATLWPQPTQQKIKAVYNSLNPLSISQHLAFYELYPDSPEGHQALQDAWELLVGSSRRSPGTLQAFPLAQTTDALMLLINKLPDHNTAEISGANLTQIEHIASFFPNRRLKGFGALTEEAVIALPTEEIDLARGLLLSQLPDTEGKIDQIRSYEALIDLMALQILAQNPGMQSDEQKIRAINRYVFEEMGFRFPPHSIYAKDVDLYTFLPSVLDSRKGVCLGVSILYLSLAQRLDLPLEVITPPGHIYVRYRKGDKIINIETTARGIHVDSEHYLGIDTRSLQERTVKEVIGMAHINHASVYWQQDEYAKALECYKKAKPYMPDDMVLKELTGYNLIFTGSEEEGLRLIKEVEHHVPDYAVSGNSSAEDLISGAVDSESIKVLFMKVDETRESILEKKNQVEEVVQRFPKFRGGVFTLATLWLQLHRMGEALELLERYDTLDPDDPTAQYYMAAIYHERRDYNKAWDHLRRAEEIVAKRDHDPKALKELRRELALACPE